ncbi:hypothetical protein G6M02_22690 [Agrobacterium rhizogenes]|nr:hypothetical protein [Rhizobium rhizogenes]
MAGHTVPLWSAVDPTRLHHVAPGVHAEVFKHEQIRAVMYRAVGARMPGVSFVSAAGKPLIMLQTGELVYATGVSVDVMLIPSNAFTEINGELVVEFSNDPMSVPFATYQRVPLIYKGPQVDQIKVRLERLSRIGFYRVDFDGTHEIDSGGQAVFAVSPTGGATGAKQ